MNKDEMRDGAAAEALLANPMLLEAFANTEAQIVNQMRSAGFKDSETHHRLVLALQMLHAIRRNIETTIETGQMARFELENKGKLARLFG
jgi:hypothetical protein